MTLINPIYMAVFIEQANKAIIQKIPQNIYLSIESLRVTRGHAFKACVLPHNMYGSFWYLYGCGQYSHHHMQSCVWVLRVCVLGYRLSKNLLKATTVHCCVLQCGKKKTVANFNRNEDLICILFWSVGQDRFAFFLFFSSCSSLLIATLLSRLIIVFVQWIGLGIFWNFLVANWNMYTAYIARRKTYFKTLYQWYIVP